VTEKKIALFGMVGPLVAYVFIFASIMFSPWFSWENNALSDLGHSVSSGVAPLFNFGLFLTGFLVIIYSIGSLRIYAKYSSYFLLASALMLQLVAVFDEVYGFLHFAVSVLFFLCLGVSSLVYAVEKRSILASATLIIGLISWILFWADIYTAGIAVPEAISSVVTLWIISSAMQAFLSNQS
jgi:hypothetical membrane protein